jgi:predicted aspartyl protease
MLQQIGMIGSTGPDGSPVIRISIEGVRSVRHDFDAILDTGFTGFVSMSVQDAFPLGLVLHSIDRVVYADGRDQERFIAVGTVRLGKDSREGYIHLEPSSGEILLGMEFLRAFHFSLLLDPFTNFVQLFDEADTKRIIDLLAPNPENDNRT